MEFNVLIFTSSVPKAPVWSTWLDYRKVQRRFVAMNVAANMYSCLLIFTVTLIRTCTMSFYWRRLENTDFLIYRISNLVDILKDDFSGMVQHGFSEVKEVRKCKNEILVSTSQWTAVQHDTTLSQAEIENSVKQLQKSADKLERQESNLQEDLRHWRREQEINTAANQENVEQQLQEILTKLENLSLQHAKEVAYLASGHLQCPCLFVLWPFRGPCQLRARRLI